MGQKQGKDILVLFIFFKPALGLKQTDNFTGVFEMGIMLHKMKQIPIFKAGIGEDNTVAIFFSGIGSRSQRFVAVVVTVKDTPDFIAAFGAVFGLAD